MATATDELLGGLSMPATTLSDKDASTYDSISSIDIVKKDVDAAPANVAILDIGTERNVLSATHNDVSSKDTELNELQPIEAEADCKPLSEAASPLPDIVNATDSPLSAPEEPASLQEGVKDNATDATGFSISTPAAGEVFSEESATAAVASEKAPDEDAPTTSALKEDQVNKVEATAIVEKLTATDETASPLIETALVSELQNDAAVIEEPIPDASQDALIESDMEASPDVPVFSAQASKEETPVVVEETSPDISSEAATSLAPTESIAVHKEATSEVVPEAVLSELVVDDKNEAQETIEPEQSTTQIEDAGTELEFPVAEEQPAGPQDVSAPEPEQIKFEAEPETQSEVDTEYKGSVTQVESSIVKTVAEPSAPADVTEVIPEDETVLPAELTTVAASSIAEDNADAVEPAAPAPSVEAVATTVEKIESSPEDPTSATELEPVLETSQGVGTSKEADVTPEPELDVTKEVNEPILEPTVITGGDKPAVPNEEIALAEVVTVVASVAQPDIPVAQENGESIPVSEANPETSTLEEVVPDAVSFPEVTAFEALANTVDEATKSQAVPTLDEQSVEEALTPAVETTKPLTATSIEFTPSSIPTKQADESEDAKVPIIDTPEISTPAEGTNSAGDNNKQIVKDDLPLETAPNEAKVESESPPVLLDQPVVIQESVETSPDVPYVPTEHHLEEVVDVPVITSVDKDDSAPGAAVQIPSEETAEPAPIPPSQVEGDLEVPPAETLADEGVETDGVSVSPRVTPEGIAIEVSSLPTETIDSVPAQTPAEDGAKGLPDDSTVDQFPAVIPEPQDPPAEHGVLADEATLTDTSVVIGIPGDSVLDAGVSGAAREQTEQSLVPAEDIVEVQAKATEVIVATDVVPDIVEKNPASDVEGSVDEAAFETTDQTLVLDKEVDAALEAVTASTGVQEDISPALVAETSDAASPLSVESAVDILLVQASADKSSIEASAPNQSPVVAIPPELLLADGASVADVKPPTDLLPEVVVALSDSEAAIDTHINPGDNLTSDIGNALQPVDGAAIERPKSPWTPSYSVTSQGPGIIPEGDIHVLDAVGQKDVAPASPSPVPEIAPSDADEPAKAPSLIAEPEDSNAAPLTEIVLRAWTPSYSVAVQGSPIEKRAELVDNAPVVTNPVPDTAVEASSSPPTLIVEQSGDGPGVAPKSPSWTSSYSVSVQGSPRPESLHLGLESEQTETSAKPDVNKDNATPNVPVQATVDESPTEQLLETLEIKEEFAAAEGLVTVSEAEPVVEPKILEDIPGLHDVIEPSVSQEDTVVDDTVEVAPEEDQVVKVDENTSALANDANKPEIEQTIANDIAAPSPVFNTLLSPLEPSISRPSSPSSWSASYTVTQQGRISPSVPEVATDKHDAAEVEDNEHDLSIPQIIEQPAPPALSVDVSISDPVADRPRSPWTPSYSVTMQGPDVPDTPGDEEALDKLEQLPANILRESSSPPAVVVEETLGQSNVVDVPIGTGAESVKPAHVFPSKEPEADLLSPLSASSLTATEADGLEPPVSPRSRLESTASSRFFPGGWFTKAPEGRASLDSARGEFVSKQTSSAIDPATSKTVAEEQDAPATTASDTEEKKGEKKGGWCVVM